MLAERMICKKFVDLVVMVSRTYTSFALEEFAASPILLHARGQQGSEVGKSPRQSIH
jgi:hypothetical protein